jgi:hypothetical protein
LLLLATGVFYGLWKELTMVRQLERSAPLGGIKTATAGV